MTGSAVQPRIHYRYFPVFGAVLMNFYLIILQVNRNVRLINIIIHKILFYHIYPVSAAYNKFMKPVCGKTFHNMPQQRFPSDLCHRLRNTFLFITDRTPCPSRQNNYFHILFPFSFMIRTAPYMKQSSAINTI